RGQSLRSIAGWRSRDAPSQDFWPSRDGHARPDDLLRAQHDARCGLSKGSAQLLEVTFSSGPERRGDRYDDRGLREISISNEPGHPRTLSRRGGAGRDQGYSLSSEVGRVQLPRAVAVDEPRRQRTVHKLGARELCRDATFRRPRPLFQLPGRRRSGRSVSGRLRPQFEEAPGTKGQIRPGELLSYKPEHPPTSLKPIH